MNTTLAFSDLMEDRFLERNLVAGEWVFPALPYELDFRSPATSELIASIPLSSGHDVRCALTAAREAAASWVEPDGRLGVLERFAELLDVHARSLAHVQCVETGMHPEDSRLLVESAGQLTRRLIAIGREMSSGRVPPTVVGHVLAAGAPIVEITSTVMASLSVGSAVVAKPSVRAPLVAAAVGRLLDAAGAPAGTLNVVQGLGNDVGTAMVSDPEFDQVCLRGRARWVRRAVAQRIRMGKPEPLSMTGAATTVAVGENFDPDELGLALRRGIRAHTAGGPLRIDRLIASSRVYDEVVDVAVETALGLLCAPLPSSAQREHARTAVERAVAAGARPLTDHRPPDDVRHRMGWFMPPALLETADAELPLPGVPGPVLSIQRGDIGEFSDRLESSASHSTTVIAGEAGKRAESLPALSVHVRGIAEGRLPAGWLLSGVTRSRPGEQGTARDAEEKV